MDSDETGTNRYEFPPFFARNSIFVCYLKHRFVDKDKRSFNGMIVVTWSAETSGRIVFFSWNEKLQVWLVRVMYEISLILQYLFSFWVFFFMCGLFFQFRQDSGNLFIFDGASRTRTWHERVRIINEWIEISHFCAAFHYFCSSSITSTRLRYNTPHFVLIFFKL